MSNAPYTQADSHLDDANVQPPGYRYADMLHKDDIIWPDWYARAEFNTWGRMLIEDRKAAQSFYRDLLNTYSESRSIAEFVRLQIEDSITYGTDKGLATVY